MTEAQELGRMKRVRNGHRTSTKRTISAANDLLTSVDDKSKLAPHVVKLTLKKKTLEDKLVVFQQQDNAILELVARKDILRKGGRCFLCLKKNHLCRDCNSKTQCFKCRSRHHISICTKDNNERKSENPANVQKDAQQDQGLQAQQKTGSENNPLKQQTNGTNLLVSSKTPVLLQTAQATITQDDTTVNSAKKKREFKPMIL
ncbi:PREDICTED: uncharacterized protein LOC107346460 [Paramuricea clavata]|uniref:PREDICTED: uncharacterized protein LOC107346460 n=1 Tax=Paramuricea clavata TaxID=317549 RepID=A0A7D9LEZ0_PARCT|nr:PREDICTED: uncharacterized protein LOC107346460 [Paramuricea clavata]